MAKANTSKTRKDVGAGKKSEPKQKTESLSSLIVSRSLTEQLLQDAEGEVTNKMDVIWQQQDLAVKDKLDAYGFVFTDLDAQEEKLKTIKDKIQVAYKRIDDVRTKMKARLNFLSEGEPLRGNIYSFIPYQTSHKVITDTTQLSPSETYLTIEIRRDFWDKLLAQMGIGVLEIEYEIKKETAKVSELPNNHPAISTLSEPSVRIT